MAPKKACAQKNRKKGEKKRGSSREQPQERQRREQGAQVKVAASRETFFRERKAFSTFEYFGGHAGVRYNVDAARFCFDALRRAAKESG